MINAVSVTLITSIYNVSNTTDTSLLFNFTLRSDVINAASVALLLNHTSLREFSNAADTTLLFEYGVNNINMSIFVVC